MKRYLVWHIPPGLARSGDDSQGPVFYADHDYTPAAFRLYAGQAPASGDLTVDIRADGVSIFTSNYATLTKGETFEEQAEDYPDIQPIIEDGSVISFHIIDKAGAEGITGQLELESLNDEDDESE
jgi:hypothetical protein